ncbi:MAG: hypothetical protein H6853_04390 [Rhodospirillales bacterium]|nr:hypothetical protein [Alphaproteobacteria bacterium]USO04508.1 MAG: hypothetical protein H6853_04390 [Rhodospirillales bacterium]
MKNKIRNTVDKLSGKIASRVRLYVLGAGGAMALIFGLTVPVVVSAVGVSVDMAQSYLVHERLSRALDAAALAAAAMASNDQTEIEQKVNDFMDINYPTDEIGATYGIVVEVNGNELYVKAYAQLDTAFMRIFGIDEVDVMAETVVQREIRGLEVVLVLDNTGSMSTNNNIGALKDASENFVNILFERVNDPEDVRIGLVPYSSSVNVGPYGWGVDLDGNNYGTPFITNPASDVYTAYTSSYGPYAGSNYGIAAEDLEYDPSAKGQWHGCVLAHDYPADTTDHSGPWEMYRYDWNGSTSSYYTGNVYKWSPYMTYADYYNTYYGPKYHCPVQPIVPLSSDQDLLVDSINNMTADGFTLGNYGMVWGWRVISPEEPFTEGAEYDDNEWDKAILMMTDGVNTMNHAYTAYGKTNQHSISPDDLNDRFAEVCDAIKEEGIIIYTVTFYSGVDEETKDFYRACATDITKYHDAPSQEDLIEVFEQISRELSNLHIKQ